MDNKSVLQLCHNTRLGHSQPLNQHALHEFSLHRNAYPFSFFYSFSSFIMLLLAVQKKNFA